MTKTKFLIFLLILFYSSLFSQTPQSSLNFADSLSVDSLAVNIGDSLDTAVKRDTLKPLYYSGFTKNNGIGLSFPKAKIDKTDYRFIGDSFNYLPFGYHADLGAVGSPSEVYLYGLGFNNISYLNNGIEITNRYQNSLDLNLFQTEAVDIIEVPSLASGFVYNNANNPVTVNFISKNLVTVRPYSRIRFYQAPDNEGAFNGQFSAYFIKRVNISFEISNQSADGRYKNSELSNWQFNTHVRYMPSNSLNIIAGYSFANLNMDLNGGVDVLSTPDLLYDVTQANVNFLDRYHKTTRHSFSLSSIFEVDSISTTNLSFYYQYNLDEFRQNEFTTDSSETRIVNNNSYKTYGVNLQQRLSLFYLMLDVIGNIEKTDFEVAYSSINSFNSWSLGGKLSGSFLANRINPSVFFKTSGIDGRNYSGFGGEVKLIFTDWLSVYGGTSFFNRDINHFLSPAETKTNDVTIMEAGLSVNYSFVNLGLKYFSIEQSDFAIGTVPADENFIYQSAITNYDYANVKRNGLNIDLLLKFWKLQLHSNTSLYFGETELIDYSMPTVTSFGGFYYVDTLFNNNLDLKAGVNYKFFGERGYSVYDFQRLQQSFNYTNGFSISGYNSNLLIGNNYQLDLFIAGTIQEAATVYIVWENFSDESYYQVSYYPQYSSAFRFGLAWRFLD